MASASIDRFLLCRDATAYAIAFDPHVGILKGFLLRMTIHRPPAASEMDDISCFASTPPLYAVQASDLPKQYSLLRAEFPTDFDARRGFGKTESTKRKGRNPARMDMGGGKNHLFFEKMSSTIF